MIELGILLALLCALGTNVAFLCKHRGAVAAPAVRFSHPLRSSVALFRSRWWAIGMGIAVVAWTLHVAALALAPLSTVQMVISGGLVLLAWPAERWFGFRLGRREWCGLGLSAAGLACLAVTADVGGSSTHSSYSVVPMLAFEAGLLAVGTLMLLPGTAGRIAPQSGVLLGAAAGILIGVSDVALKALAGTVPSDLLSILSPWTLSAIVASVLAFFAMARGLQLGDAIPVIALSSIAANCTAILGGVLVFGDPVGSGAVEVVARSLAFAAVIAAAALMPGPIRAARVAS
jgi:drug/metabolite transporter (DMT)-like permease